MWRVVPMRRVGTECHLRSTFQKTPIANQGLAAEVTQPIGTVDNQQRRNWIRLAASDLLNKPTSNELVLRNGWRATRYLPWLLRGLDFCAVTIDELHVSVGSTLSVRDRWKLVVVASKQRSHWDLPKQCEASPVPLVVI